MKEFFKRLTDQDTAEIKHDLEELCLKLKSELDPGAKIFTHYEERRIYSRDLAEIPSFLERMLFRTTPLIVIQPNTCEDLEKILKIAELAKRPVYPRGIASWGLGGAVPTMNGIVVDFSPMDRIGSPDEKNFTITVQAGAKWGLIDEILEESGMMLPVSPSSRFSTVGGWVSTGGYGLNSLYFGHFSEWVKEIKVVTPQKGVIALAREHEDFMAFFHTEGQLGLIYEVTLKLVPKIREEYPHLAYFDTPEQAFDFSSKLLESKLVPLHLNFKGVDLIKEINLVWEKKLLEEKPAMLFAYNEKAQDDEYRKNFPQVHEAPRHISRLMWLERFRPLKRKEIVSSILASETIFPLDSVSKFMKKALVLGRNFRTHLFFEFHFIKTRDSYKVLAMTQFNCDRRKIIQYYAYLALVPALTRLGIKFGGKPYGIGIWNVPFFATGFNKQIMKKILDAKKKYDPLNIMNPRKFTSIRSRFYNIPSKLFHPIFFNLTMDTLMFISPLLGILLPPLKLQIRKKPDILEKGAFLCTSCGNCLPVCPVYVVTKRESTSPRGKLSLARMMIKEKKIPQILGEDAFLCTKCRNCERVCQSSISHFEVWEDLEQRLKKITGIPEAKIHELIDSLPENENYLNLIACEKWENL